MRITLVFDEDDISLTKAAIAVKKYRHNPATRAVVVENDTYFVKHDKGTKVYYITSEDFIKSHF